MTKPFPLGSQQLSVAEALKRAVGLHEQGHLGRAEELYRTVLNVQPDHVDALHYLGVMRLQQSRHDEAVSLIGEALRHRPNFPDALCNRGTALQALNRLEEAVMSYDTAIAIRPDYANALFNRGNALRILGHYTDALASYDKALAIQPDFAVAHTNRGNALDALGRHEAALASYDKALAIRPRYPEALCCRGSVLRKLMRFKDALETFQRVAAIDAGFRHVQGEIAIARGNLCKWQGHDRLVRRLIDGINAGHPVSLPFALLTQLDDPAAQLKCAAAFVRDLHPARQQPLWTGERYHHDRIRIAYLSADFHDHATAYLAAGLFERHDRERFEIIGISCGPDQPGAMRTRLVAAFDRFVNIRAMGDPEAARLLREHEIDVVVDMKGFTLDARLDILAHRPAPIQVSYLGYPGTMGASYIDYIIADELVIPPSDHACYAERIVYLPDCYQVNDSRRSIAEQTPSRTDWGLPERGFVYCCFNNNYKITPDIFDIWMRLLSRVPGSVLWLLEDNTTAAQNLRREAQRRGVAPERLVFAQRIDLPEHLARQRRADLFLDTLPVNAHTTASDALWAGLPLLTCKGRAFAGRVAASLLQTVGLPELVTDSLADYEAQALMLATSPDKLTGIRTQLAHNRMTHPLFDTDRFCRHIESAYITMWERYQRDESPTSFTVAPIT